MCCAPALHAITRYHTLQSMTLYGVLRHLTCLSRVLKSHQGRSMTAFCQRLPLPMTCRSAMQTVPLGILPALSCSSV